MDENTELLENLAVGKKRAKAVCRKPPYRRNNGNGSKEVQLVVPTIIPAVHPLPDKMVAEEFAETLADALKSFDLTESAKELLEKGLYGQIEVNVGQVVADLQGLIDSPLQGVLEANRMGAMGKLYKGIDVVLSSLMTDLATMDIPRKMRLLDILLLRLKSLNEVAPSFGGGNSGGGRLGPKGIVPPGSLELSETRTVRVNLTERKDRKKADEMLGYDERPGADYLEQ